MSGRFWVIVNAAGRHSDGECGIKGDEGKDANSFHGKGSFVARSEIRETRITVVGNVRKVALCPPLAAGA